jgi:Flp pilus assembly protein TadG
MPDTNLSQATFRQRSRQRGTAAVEFALVVIMFLILVFGVIEFARVMYLINTLAEVTRRAATAAVNTDFSNSAALDGVRRNAIFNSASGVLPLSDQMTSDAIRIDYLSVQRNAGGSFSMTVIPTGSLPADPMQNRQVCLVNPYANNCIRLVRVRVCDPGNTGSCDPVQFQGVVPVVDFSLPLPISTTISRAESLGVH